MWGRRRCLTERLLAKCTRSATPLDESVAMATALTWEADWRPYGRLQTGSTLATPSVIESYDFIEFDLSRLHNLNAREREKTLAKFHAVTVIWAIISWCPGYGSVQNPVFWKQVFDRRDLSDAARFFRYEAFPRVLLHFETTNHLKLVPDTIFAYCNSNVGFFIRRHVESTLRTSAPFISPSRVTQVINVTVAVRCVRSSDYYLVFGQLRAIRDTKRSSRPSLAGVQVKVDNLTPGFITSSSS